MSRGALKVWLHGEHVADVTGTRTGAVDCRYTAAALDRWPGNIPLLSCSLPLKRGRLGGSAPFFKGLLPEGAARRAMAETAGVPVTDVVGMLARFGRDVAGALVIAGTTADRQASVEYYDDDVLAAEVAALAERPLGLHDDSELSLAGLQDKLLLVQTDRGWARPRHGYPSTHILKVEDRRFPGMAAAEAAALRLAAAVGLTSATAGTVDVGGVSCLVVSRFDREQMSGGCDEPLRRVHQEDACQALGVDADAAFGRGKYESTGGPGLADVARLLERHSADPDAQLRRLLAATVFTVLIGNADAHGKNLALLHRAPGAVELAPLYDTVPTALFPGLRGEAAMLVNGRLHLARVTGADLVGEAQAWGVPRAGARAVVEDVATRLASAASTPILDDVPQLRAMVQARADAVVASLGS
ncbi:MAG: HipA domain-containing protein [Kineosporiaceae bacterium]